jgi:FkbM family methyltransferase
MLLSNVQLNTQNNITCFHNAFWVDNSLLSIEESFRDGREWAFSARPILEKTQILVQGITLKDLLQKNEIQEIDILKIDIEGGEKWILEDLKTMEIIKEKVKMLIIEIHEEVILMEEAKNILQNYSFSFYQKETLLLAFPIQNNN